MTKYRMEVTKPDGTTTTIPIGWWESFKDAKEEAEDVIRYSDGLHGSVYKLIAE